ncbi:MAG: histidine kinase [Gemmatimonadetes bacterium]|nr:histidine kinase [Gemmatimonadota bacterium]
MTSSVWQGRIRFMAVSGAIWLTLAVVSLSQMAISMPGWTSGRPTQVVLALHAPTYASWWLLTPFIFRLADRYRVDERPRGAALAVHAAAALSIALVPTAASVAFMQLIDTGLMPGAGRNLLGLRYGFDVITYLGVVGVATGLRLRDASRRGELRALRLEGALARARLAALSSQLEPHFLYNALNSVAMLIRRKDHERALSAVVGYGALLRGVVAGEATEVPLRDEIAFIERYLELEQLRFPGALTTSLAIPADAADALVPRLLLLPLVENALHHGFVDATADARLDITARATGERLLVSVADNGRGFQPDAAGTTGTGQGLANTRQRLATCYGDDQALTFETGAGRGTTVHVDMPRRTVATA